MAYYSVGAKEKARKLFQDVAIKYQEKLIYFSGLSIDNQERLFEDIYIDIERYRALVDVLIVEEDDSDYVEAEMKKFNSHLRLFSYFVGEDDINEETEQQEEESVDTVTD